MSSVSLPFAPPGLALSQEPMSGERATRRPSTLSADARLALLAHEEPGVIEKLLHNGVACDEEQARVLFREVKRYFVLCDAAGLPLPMTSALVDAAWHQFVLFTREYEQFCRDNVGAFCHHSPTLSSGPSEVEITHADFVSLYEDQFGPVPEVWRDWECVSLSTRLRRQRGFESLSAERRGSQSVLLRGVGGDEVVCRASARALPALELIASQSCLLVRELPSLRSPDEQLSLIRPLVRYRILRLAV